MSDTGESAAPAPQPQPPLLAPQTSYATPLSTPSSLPGSRIEPAAIVALVLSMLSYVIWILPAIVALAMGHAAKRNIDASNGYRRGKGLAIASLVLSLLSLFIAAAVLLIIAFN